MPKKTAETDFTTVASSQGTDHISTVSSGNSSSGSIVSASDVNSNNLGGFIGENVQSNLDSLSSEARKNQPPLMGQDPVGLPKSVRGICNSRRKTRLGSSQS